MESEFPHLDACILMDDHPWVPVPLGGLNSPALSLLLAVSACRHISPPWSHLGGASRHQYYSDNICLNCHSIMILKTTNLYTPLTDNPAKLKMVSQTFPLHYALMTYAPWLALRVGILLGWAKSSPISLTESAALTSGPSSRKKKS